MATPLPLTARPEDAAASGAEARARAPRTLEGAPADAPMARFRRGRERPRAIAWFGFSAFWGHLRHLVASAIATENIDSRQWMMPESPEALLERAVDVLAGRGATPAATLAAAMGGEVWIDFVADTGDDREVSERTAELIAGEYEVPDPDGGAPLRLPRGHVLFHGGDLAYPVATVREITRRLLDPWNRVFEREGDDLPRLLLGVPGNHDWYDGLDGFARLCQAPLDFERREDRESRPNEHPVLAWAEAFTRGEAVRKPDALALFGYYPIQRTSYFRMPLARGLELWGVDRQLKQVDPRQRQFFHQHRGPVLVVLPDPARSWGEDRPDGKASLEAIGVDPSRRAAYVLCGDIHHYERSAEGARGLHVVAGGGGAFLQGARVAGGAAYRLDAEFPGPRASWSLLKRLPLHVARGGAGWLITAAFALMLALELGAHLAHGRGAALPYGVFHSTLVAVSTAALVGWRRHRWWRVLPMAVALGLFIGILPLAMGLFVDHVGMRALGPTALARACAIGVAWLLATLATGAAFGAMLALIARLGLNHAQPFAALGLPTHKHFVRIRVRETEAGAVVDSFVVGQVDPVGGSPPVLVDHFRWTPHAGPADR